MSVLTLTLTANPDRRPLSPHHLGGEGLPSARTGSWLPVKPQFPSMLKGICLHASANTAEFFLALMCFGLTSRQTLPDGNLQSPQHVR